MKIAQTKQTLGTVYLVGAGPGAPDLLTLRAARLLAQADIVFYDALVHPDTIALATNAVKVAVGKRCGTHSTAQSFINKRLVDAAQKYAVVVRLKGGDPMIFGRAQEEIDALVAASVPVEIVPGITAALAVAAELKVSLTQRGNARSVAFVTPRVGPTEKPSEWLAALRAADTGMVYMGAGEAQAIATQLVADGMVCSTPIVLVEGASLAAGSQATQHRATLGDLADGWFPTTAGGPVMLGLGEAFAKARIKTVQSDVRTKIVQRA